MAPTGTSCGAWSLGPFNNPFVHGASPILAGEILLMVCDQDTNSFLLAIDKHAGRVIWRTERPHAQLGCATPILYQPRESGLQVLVTGTHRLSGYDARTGKELWWIRRLPSQIKPTPVLDGDTVYFVTFSAETEPGEQEILPAFAEALVKLDRNHDGRISKDELEDARAKARFDEYLDLDHTGYLEERDGEHLRERRLGESGLRAYRLGGQGDLTESGLLWKNVRSLPNVPSPLVYRGVLYTLKEGGILTSFDPRSGAIVKQGRLHGAPGDYYASPVAADGKIYAVSEEGKVAVIRAGEQWELIGVNDVEDGSRSTPAIAGRKDVLAYVQHSLLLCWSRSDKAGNECGPG